MNANEIIEDQIYAEAYKSALNAFQKKNKKLAHRLEKVLEIYLSGGQDELCDTTIEMKYIVSKLKST